jgi:hypothetical protein
MRFPRSQREDIGLGGLLYGLGNVLDDYGTASAKNEKTL